MSFWLSIFALILVALIIGWKVIVCLVLLAGIGIFGAAVAIIEREPKELPPNVIRFPRRK